MIGIGESPPRPDGFAKVSGSARYVDDVSLPGMWHGATLRSPHPHARIRSIRFNAAKAPEGAVCVTAADLPGPNGVQLLDDGWPILADGFSLHVGEPIALVAAPTRLAARQALAAFTVEYEPLDPILTLEAAETLPPLYELRLENGDVEAAFAAAEHVIEGTWRTGHQEHIYIECNGMIASFENGGALTLLGSMQCPYYVHKALTHAFQLPEDKVRVRASVVGGGFGGKEDFPSALAIHAGLLARACGRPVKMIYDRHEDIVSTSKRHPAVVCHRTAVSADGRLLALDAEILMDGGAYKTLSPVVLSRALLHCFGPYRWPSVRVRGKVLRTHTAPNSAFRGFGAPQVEFAIERQMDRIGRELGLDPYEIRDRNVVEPGDRLPTGQILDASTSARLCLEEVERRTGFRRRWKELEEARDSAADGEPRRGIGLSLYFHGAGFTGNGERKMRSPVTARLLEDGRIEVLTAMTDMGQGCAAVFPQIAMAAGGVGADDVIFAEPDTGDVPDSGPTVASRTTMIVGGLIARTVAELRDRVLAWRSASEKENLSIREGWIENASGRAERFRDAARRYREETGPVEVTIHNEPPEWQTFDESTYRGAAYPTYAWGADVVEVEVDPDTLAARPVQVTAVCEVGRAIHKTLCAGQIEGGTLQALGWALMEEIKLQDGRYLNDRLATYIIPTAKDSPRIDVHLLERSWEGGPFGAKGVGELPMDGGAPAAVQAIENATGALVNEIPATPERLMKALGSSNVLPSETSPPGPLSSEAGEGERRRGIPS
ncbi:MAG TPA: xanthine dehydrogenase family protein molybdopterin-binding subunit [Thermoanaerobaculia bacterium]|jgi:CO/xanthine dehydrogenase Mo-binding subunit|nr:xanthine dehydrogenase family protein molybdopterin-binding subunit [Thermoanaerobaculia bacterium]